MGRAHRAELRAFITAAARSNDCLRRVIDAHVSLTFGVGALLDVALELERIALHDEYFIEKKLYPNIDFYSGITLKAMGFPTDMFTALFALARTTGWIAQWKEMIEDPSQKIGRPRQLYTGAPRREYTPLAQRR